MKNLCLFLISCLIYFHSFSQDQSTASLFQEILNLDYTNNKSNLEKLKFFYSLKTKIENAKPLNDSAYILVLLKISKYEFLAQNNIEAAINFSNSALTICNSLKKENFKSLTINCYFNLASSYQQLAQYRKALLYYDTVLFKCDKGFVDTNYFKMDTRYNKADIYFFLGDYQKIIDECNEGINLSVINKDSSYLVYFLNSKAQSFYYLNNLKNAFNYVSLAIKILQKINNKYQLATAYKTLGLIYEKKVFIDSAEYFFNESIKIRNATKYYQQIVNDYIDLGNFYLNTLLNYKNAEQSYNQALVYASKIQYPNERSLRLALVNLNLGETFLRQKKYEEATSYFLQSFSDLHINLHNNIKENLASAQLSNIANKDLVIVLMNDKTNLLLEEYKTNHDKTFINACIQSAIFTDSVITQIRHELLGEQSKLYWRDKTRDFYTVALEACYLASKPDLAFYFMEKSRAVLLNDKLNELNAASYLSKSDAATQENYEIKIVELEQKLSSLSDTSKNYESAQLQYLSVKNELEQFIKSLEQKYPAYYQYKYADDVPSLQQLQSYLKKNNQSFVHYFIGDTVTYILATTPSTTKFISLSQKNFNKEQLVSFLQLCSNKEALLNNYNSFALLSNSIFNIIFKPLQLQKGSVIICADNIVIPFDALCTDNSGKKFLVNDYIFSYVYSARSLMKPCNYAKATGNFIGFAPVSFASYLGVQPLLNAANALKSSSKSYSSEKLFTYQNATKNNFFTYSSSYSVVSIFSHARADTSENEPVLFMQDSVIHLSELQSLKNTATQLVLLSACQTNVGKNATGEGIYSLARGFAMAGIPSISATLWKADEETIYNISEKFNQYLANGMNKDEALQKAKSDFIQKNQSTEKLLPYYWANIILIGNTDVIKLQPPHSNNWWFIITGIIALAAILYILIKRKAKKSNLK